MELTLEQKQENAKKLIEIGMAIAQARIDFGLVNNQSDPNADVATAKSILDGILVVRKAYRNEDVLESIKLFGKGIIRFENQLNVVSVQNAIRAYEFYIREYLPKINLSRKEVNVIPASHQLLENVEAKNLAAKRELFEAYINDPKGVLEPWFARFYEICVEIGAIQANDGQRTEMYRSIITEIFNSKNYPAEIWADSLKRRDMFAYKNMIENGGWPNLAKVINNHFHQFAVKKAKMQLIGNALKNGKQKLIEQFDRINAK